MSEQLYRIHWRAIKTGATGHGTGAFPKWEAEKYSKAMNEQYRGEIVHWIEPAPQPESEAKQ